MGRIGDVGMGVFLKSVQGKAFEQKGIRSRLLGAPHDADNGVECNVREFSWFFLWGAAGV